MATQVSLNSGAVASAGALALQTNGTTEAVSISTGQVATLAQNPILTSGTANGVAYLNGSKAVTSGSALVFDGTNLGVGVTPSAWAAGNKVLSVGSYASLMSNASNGNYQLVNNAYNNGTNNIYVNTNYATLYQSYQGQHQWYNAPSGTAGNAITFTQAMTLNASGGLQTLNTIGVGNTTPSTSGAGISFPATQSASSDANTLDDYEEGTWSPTLDVESGTSPTYTVTRATYTKIGRWVYAYADFSITAAGSGLLRLNFPFFPVVSLNNYGGAKAQFSDNTYQNLIMGGYSTNRCLFTQNGSTSYFVNASSLKGTSSLTVAMYFEVS